MIGIDIVETERIGKLLSRWGEKFLDRILSQEEKDYVFGKKKRMVESLSGIFAAKEAFLKASGKKLPLKKIKVVHNQGKPYIICGEKIYRNLSISHERKYAVAVIIVPSEGGFYESPIP